MPTSPHLRSKKNHGTEKEGVQFLLKKGPEYQVVSAPIKQRVLEILELDNTHTPRCFDLIRVVNHRGRVPRVRLSNVRRLLAAKKLRLLEVKTTKKKIWDEQLGGFFFGATKSEYQIARKLGDLYKFAFVVLQKKNSYGTHFHVELTLEEVQRRTLRKRIQYQVNF